MTTVRTAKTWTVGELAEFLNSVADSIPVQLAIFDVPYDQFAIGIGQSDETRGQMVLWIDVS